MNYLLRYILFVLLLFVLGCGDYKSQANVVSVDTSAGELVYNNNGSLGNKCVDCHAADGSGVFGLGPDIRSASSIGIANAVRTGPSTMPAYSSVTITDEELSDLIVFVLTL